MQAQVLVTVAAAALAPMRILLHYATHSTLNVSSDSAVYLNSARSMGRGLGHTDSMGAPLTLFPPGYPGSIAALDAVLPGNEMIAALAVNAISLLAVGLAIGVLVMRTTDHWWLPGLVVAFAGTGPVMQGVGEYAWSEPLALGLCAWAVVGATQPDTLPRSRIIWVGVACAAAVLVRTASAFFVIGLALALFLLGRRLAAIAVAVIGALPATAWAAWNLWRNGSALGTRGQPFVGPLESVKQAAIVASGWFSFSTTGMWRLFGFVGVAALTVLIVRALLRDEKGRAAAVTATVAGACVAVGVVGSSTLVAIDYLDNRLLSQLYLCVVLAAAATVAHWRTRPMVALVIAGATLASIQGLVGRPAFRDPVREVACNIPPADILLSNTPNQLAYRCDIPVARAPRARVYGSNQTTDELRELTEAVGSRCVRIIWVGDDHAHHGYLNTPQQLREAGFVEEPLPGSTMFTRGC